MNDKNRQLYELERLRKSIDERKARTKDFWKSFLRTGIIMCTAVIVLILISIAWFVMNNRTQAESSAISASDERIFSLATLATDIQGVYDNNEQSGGQGALGKALSRYWRTDNNGRDDEKGNYYKFFSWLPSLNAEGTHFTDKDGVDYILGDSDGISLRVNPESNVNNMKEFDYVEPGSYGQLTFYIIPHIESLEKVTLSVSLQAFTLVSESVADNKEATGKAVEIQTTGNEVLMNMLQGHMLLFAGKDENENYSNRILPILESDGRVCFAFEKNNTNWVKDQAERITIYWIWPKRFENIKYCGQEDSVFKSECAEHTELLKWVDNHKNCVVNTNVIDTSSLKGASESMTNAEFGEWSTGYNKGDQLIGENVAFFQWIIEAE